MIILYNNSIDFINKTLRNIEVIKKQFDDMIKNIPREKIQVFAAFQAHRRGFRKWCNIDDDLGDVWLDYYLDSAIDGKSGPQTYIDAPHYRGQKLINNPKNTDIFVKVYEYDDGKIMYNRYRILK